MPLIERKRCHCRAPGTYVRVDPERRPKASRTKVSEKTREISVPVRRVRSHVRGQPNSEEVEEAEKKPVVAEVVVIEEGASCSGSSIVQT